MFNLLITTIQKYVKNVPRLHKLFFFKQELVLINVILFEQK